MGKERTEGGHLSVTYSMCLRVIGWAYNITRRLTSIVRFCGEEKEAGAVAGRSMVKKIICICYLAGYYKKKLRMERFFDSSLERYSQYGTRARAIHTLTL